MFIMSPITVVIPVYNRAHTLPRTLRSIESQNIAPAAVVLVDNNSTDGSLPLMQEWAASHDNVIVVSERRPGASAARNRGLSEVMTDWTMFFDSDDEMLPTHIEDFTRAIAENPGVDIMGRDYMTERDGKLRRQYYSASNPVFSHIFRSSLSTLRYAARTELFRRCGGWNMEVGGWDDYELGMRLLMENPVMGSVGGDPSAIAHFESESLTGESFTARGGEWEKVLATMRRVAHEHGRHDVDRWLDARSMVLAAEYAIEARTLDCEKMRGQAEVYSRALYEEVMARTDCPRRMNLIFRYRTVFPRLAWVLARAIL